MLKFAAYLFTGLLITALSLNSLSAQTTQNPNNDDPLALPIRNLKVENPKNCLFSASWDKPYDGTGWFTLSMSDFEEGFETDYTEYIWAQCFNPNILKSFGIVYKGATATKIKFFVPPSGGGIGIQADYELKIYKGNSGTGPETELLSQPIKSNILPNSWNEIELKDPIMIDPSTEFWIGVHSHLKEGDGQLAAKDSGPMFPMGNMIWVPMKGWQKVKDLLPDFNANWMIAVYVVGPDGKEIVLGKETEGLLGYNIYCNDKMIGSTTECFYEYEIERTDKYNIGVAANFESGEARRISVRSGIFCESECTPPENLQFEREGDQLTLTWEVESDLFVSEIFRDGEKLEGTFSSPFTETVDPDRIYEYCVNKLCGFSESETVCIQTVGIDDDAFAPLRIYPNPASSVVNIEKKDMAKVEIYNIAGQMIASKTENLSTIDVSAYDEGVYLFKIYDRKGRSTTKSVMVVK